MAEQLANNALTTLDKVKKNLSNTFMDMDDDLIIQKINEVSDWIEKTYCNRKFGKNSYAEKHAGSNRQNISLYQYPILSVDSVKVNNEPLNPSEYEILSEQGMLFRFVCWPAAYQTYQAMLGLNLIVDPDKVQRNIEVQYTAGYVLPKDASDSNPRTLPYDLEGACISLATMRYLNRDNENMTERRVADVSEKYLNDIPYSLKCIFENYRKV